MRLHELTPEQIEEWRRARLDAGRAKYGDAHMQRYGLVDVMEELLDAENILTHLFLERMKSAYPKGMSLAQFKRLAIINEDLGRAIEGLQELDALLPDHVCSDEQGGERIWWSEQVRRDDGRD